MAQNLSSAKRPRLAAVTTTVRRFSHAQHQVDRFLDGYGWGGVYHHPAMDLVSLYIDQHGAGDLTEERAERHPGLRICPTIEEALTLGTGRLAVDGVVVVGEHGTYPLSPNGIMMRPHYEFFAAITKVFRASGRSVPYFNDKELSWKWEWSKEMVDVSRELKFPLQGGSSVAVTWRLPSVDLPLGSTVREAVGVAYGEITSYDFHMLETIQCMVERRKGGETGVAWLQAYGGDAFWQAYDDGVWSHALMKAALSRSTVIRCADQSFSNVFPTLEQMKELVRNPLAYHYQHRDGLKCTMILLDGLVRDFTFAADIAGQARPFSVKMELPEPGSNTTLASCFNPMIHAAEQMFLTGKAQYPIERTLMSSGLLIAGVDSFRAGGQRMETPNLAAVEYQPNPQSTFWRT